MSRSLMAGMTDYSHQSIDDMQTDLIEWISNLEDTLKLFAENLHQLEPTEYWTQFDYDFKGILYASKKLFETSIVNIKEVIEGFNNEVQEYHVRMTNKIGNNGSEFYSLYGKIWHSEHMKKDYGNKYFKMVENLYGEGRDMSADLIDLQNLASRLNDFVGRKGEGFKLMSSSITNHFNSPIGNVQQNYESSTGIQNISESSKELQELLIEIKEVINLLPQKEKEEAEENFEDLKSLINSDNPKTSRIKAYSSSIAGIFKKILTMKNLNNAEQLTEKLPKILEGINKISSNL